MRKRVLITALVIVAMIVALFGIVYSTSPSMKLKRALDNGTKYLNDLNYEEAKAQFLKALDIDPNNTDALKGLVSVYITEAENTVDSEDSTKQPDLYEEDDYNEAISILTSGIKEINRITGITENAVYDSEMENIKSLIAVYEKNRDSLSGSDGNLTAYLEDVLMPQMGLINNDDMSCGYVTRKSDYDGGTYFDVDEIIGEEGILGWQFCDLDGDGDSSELLVLSRSRAVKNFGKAWGDDVVWITRFDAFKYDGEVIHIGGEILDQVNDLDGDLTENYHSADMESRTILKHLPDGDEICCSAYYSSPLWADGINVHFVAYKYDGSTMSRVAYDGFLGSYGYNEYGDFSDAAREAGLEHTADYWNDESRWDDYNISPFLIPDSEPDCTDLLYVKSNSDLDYAARDAIWRGVSSKKLSDYKMDIIVTNGMKGESIVPAQNNDQVKETAPAPKLEEMTTVYGSTYYIPEGFRDVTSEVFDYERNAAGGYSSVYQNDSLGMQIQIDEFVWGNIVGFDQTAGSFLYQEYDFNTRGSVIDARMYDDYFYTLSEDASGQKYVYLQEMVNDTFCSVVTCTYPKNSKECEEVRDQFLGAFSMSE